MTTVTFFFVSGECSCAYLFSWVELVSLIRRSEMVTRPFYCDIYRKTDKRNINIYTKNAVTDILFITNLLANGTQESNNYELRKSSSASVS